MPAWRARRRRRRCDAEGYDGELTIVGAERHAPYHRPPLSKKLLTGKVHRAGIDMAPQYRTRRRGAAWSSAVGLDMSSRTIQLRDDERRQSVGFDGLVIASGAVRTRMAGRRVPDGVMLLRTVEDCLAIRERARRTPRVVVVGGGFIGAEVAASCRSLGLEVTLLSRARALMRSALGEEMGDCWDRTCIASTASTCGQGWVSTAFVGNGHVKAVRLSDGSKFRADLVLIGLGVSPATDWLAARDCMWTTAWCATPQAPLKVARMSSPPATSRAGGIRCISGTSVSSTGTMPHVRVQRRREPFWPDPDNAQEYDAVPYFWSDQYDVKLQMIGVPTDYDVSRSSREISTLGVRRRVREERTDHRGFKHDPGTGE